MSGDEAALPWWQTGVVYQVYPRSFAASGTGGVGDLDGITARLEHLAWLGVDAVWISPFYRSPMADFGYDVADHCDVDPRFGDLEACDRLVARAHELGLRVVLDLVPNHTSDQHPWFVDARSSRESEHRDWYIWRDPGPGGAAPNNWMAAFTDDSAWTLDDATGQQYLHLFLPEQPDLNWANPAVAEAIHDVMRFWLDRGVDGFRVDVIHAIGKDPTLPDDEPPWAGIPHCARPGAPSTHRHIRGMRQVIDSYAGDRVFIGETAVPGTANVAPYYGDGDQLHLAFNFAPLHAPWDAVTWRRRILRTAELILPVGWPCWVLSNHDNPRHRTRYGGSEARARAAAVMLLTLQGTPFVYQGEELGLEDAVVPDDRVVDPGGRDGCRAPIPWDGTTGHGWGTDDPWLPWPPEAGTRHVEAMRADGTSILHLYRDLIALRRRTPALASGEMAIVDSDERLLVYDRVAGSDRWRVIVAFRAADVAQELLDVWHLELDSEHGLAGPAAVPSRLPADHALLLRRA